MTTTNDATPTATYFWLATFQWPVPNGFGTATLHSTFDVDGPFSRTEALTHIKHIAGQKGVPGTASVLFLTVEPDQITGPAA